MYSTIGLYEHNKKSYQKVKESYENGEKVVGIVQATGTGKTYNALQLAYDNKDKKIIYVVPSNGIIEHIENIIKENINLEKDFPNLELRTYQSFISMSREEIKNIDCDLLILDEFHHIGAPIWGNKINMLVDTHPNMELFGMSAYTVRDRNTVYERDMANPETEELFSNKIVSRYDLCDAMIDGVLPKPIYKSAYTNLISVEEKLEEKLQKEKLSEEKYNEYESLLQDVKRRIQEAGNISDVLKKNIKPNGKYIYFCPPISEDGTNDIKTIKKEAYKWFREYVKKEDIVFYTTTSKMGIEGKRNREAFYNDTTLDGEPANDKLRIMFTINQYNEGIHAPNVDGVIMGRGTTSDIVYFEQLGRALSVRGDTSLKYDELEKYSIEELIKMCELRSLPVKEKMTKEDLIEILLAPIVIDLTNNYEFIKELENNLKDRIKQVQNTKGNNKRKIKLKNATFDIEIENQDIFEKLKYVMNRLTKTWEDYYELAKAYYEHHDNLLIPSRFKTINGYDYDENGVSLGTWLNNQRQKYSKLTKEKQELLNFINFVLKPLDNQWNQNYELAKAYYEHHGNLLIPGSFKTINGYEYDKNGVSLGKWINTQRQKYSKLTKEKQELLNSINFVSNVYDEQWMRNYELAKAYYEHHGNLLISNEFKTKNGYEYDKTGFSLKSWIKTQRQNYSKLTKEKQELLSSINFASGFYDEQWIQNYELAKVYYEHHGNLLIPYRYITTNGYEYNENGINLGQWIKYQKKNYSKLTKKKQDLLKSIGFAPNRHEEQWIRNYELAKTYYEHYGNFLIPDEFKTLNGFEYDKTGFNLKSWINHQKHDYSKLTKEQQELLNSINFVLNDYEEQWIRNYELAKVYYERHGNLLIPFRFRTTNGYEYDENGINLGQWIIRQRNRTAIESERGKLLTQIGMVWDIHTSNQEIIDMCNEYDINYDKNNLILKHISKQEFISKIKYLQYNNMAIVDENGLLTNIFSMSNSDMKKIYDVSLEELVNEYYLEKGKGV